MYCSKCGEDGNHGAGNCPNKAVTSTPPVTKQVIDLMAEIERLKGAGCVICEGRRQQNLERQRRFRSKA